jgi:hypothetical protein
VECYRLSWVLLVWMGQEYGQEDDQRTLVHVRVHGELHDVLAGMPRIQIQLQLDVRPSYPERTFRYCALQEYVSANRVVKQKR